MKIGFIGLGNMGKPMAENLLAAGFDVTGFDIAEIGDTPLRLANSAGEAAAGCDLVITMLATHKTVLSVAEEILPKMAEDGIFMDCSTIDITGTNKLAILCNAADITCIDAPVSGGIAAAAAGSLTFMVGGDKAAFARATPALEAMGNKIVHCGAEGAGQAAKICNNMILGITMIGTCEAFMLADTLGLDRGKLFDVVSGASGQSWSMTSYCPAPGIGPHTPADNGYQPGFSAALMLKDLRLSQIAAERNGARTYMGALATELYRRFAEEANGGGQDFSAMLDHILSQKNA